MIIAGIPKKLGDQNPRTSFYCTFGRDMMHIELRGKSLIAGATSTSPPSSIMC